MRKVLLFLQFSLYAKFRQKSQKSVTSLSQFAPEILSYKGGPLSDAVPRDGNNDSYHAQS